MQAEILDNLARSVKEYDHEAARSWAEKSVEAGVSPLEALDALTGAIREVGDAFGAGDCFLPELVGAAEAMQNAIPILEAQIQQRGEKRESAGVVVAGTVAGDIHNIGKTILCTLLTADGFEVIDLGIDVPVGRFVAAVKEHQPSVVAMSALLTITAQEQKKVLQALEAEGLRQEVKVIVGGGAINEQFAQSIGADGYDATAPGGVKLCRQLIQA
jgi:methanogenic corrinoid protein MtbC1